MNKALQVFAVFAICLGAVSSPVPPVEAVAEGDIALRCGSGWWSEKFRETSPAEKRFSHAGIVVKDQDGAFAVCNSVASEAKGGGFVRLDSLDDFFEPGTDAALFRLDKPEETRRDVARLALELLGRPFDPEFDLSSADKVYCTELVRVAVNGATGEETVPVSVLEGKEFAAVDSCYLPEVFSCVWDATNSIPGG